jgi:hypothetical protein
MHSAWYLSAILADGAAGGVGSELFYLVPFLLREAQVEAIFFRCGRGRHADKI